MAGSKHINKHLTVDDFRHDYRRAVIDNWDDERKTKNVLKKLISDKYPHIAKECHQFLRGKI